MAAKLSKTSTPGIFRRHAKGCEGGRCDCAYVVVWRHRGKQHTETYRTLAEARERLRGALRHWTRSPANRPEVPRAVVNLRRRSVSAATRERILKRDGVVCRRCRLTRDPQIDHIVPVALGGSDQDENLQVLCGTCNRAKGATMEEAA